MFTRSPQKIQCGISLVELIIFIVIISVALTGILMVMNQVTAHSADPLVHKQAIAVAESMLEEIRLQPLSGAACVGTLGANAPRSSVSAVCDYNGYNTTAGILDFSTNANVAGLTNYNISSVSVTQVGNLGGTAITAGSAVMINVTVADPQGQTIVSTAYRAGR